MSFWTNFDPVWRIKTLIPELSDLIEGGWEQLREKDRILIENYGYGSENYWTLDQDVGELELHFTHKKLICPCQIIGSYNPGEGSWLWSWANSSINRNLVKAAKKVKEYGIQRNIERLYTPQWDGSEEDGWTMMAVSLLLNNSIGGYRGPSDHLYIFMTISDIREVKSGPST